MTALYILHDGQFKEVITKADALTQHGVSRQSVGYDDIAPAATVGRLNLYLVEELPKAREYGRYTREIQAKVQALRETGLTYPEISKLMDIPVTTINQLALGTYPHVQEE